MTTRLKRPSSDDAARFKFMQFIGLGLLMVLPGLRVRAEQALPPPPAKTTLPEPTTPSSPFVTALSDDVLKGDRRLDVKVTLTRRAVAAEDALAELTKQSKIRMATEGNEIPATFFAIAVKDEPLRDVLRALASLNGLQWKRAKMSAGQDVLVLGTSDDPRRWEYLSPRDEYQAKEQQSVRDFASQFASLPLQMQHALADEDNGVLFSALPSEMQQNVQDIVTTELRKHGAEHTPTTISEAAITRMRVSFRVTSQQGANHLRLNAGAVNVGNVMVGVTLPNDPSARQFGILPAGFVPIQVAQKQLLTAKYASSREKSIRDDPRLSRPVSVRTEDTRIGFPLAALADAAHVNIVAQVSPDRHTVALDSVPLGGALDLVAAKYHAAWGVAPDGTILMHYREDAPTTDASAPVKTPTK